MNTPPGNPTETTETVPGLAAHNIAPRDPALTTGYNPELSRLEDEVILLNHQIAESIARQKASHFKERVEQVRLNKILKATLSSIETITKGPES